MYRIILAAIVFLCTLECDAQTTQRLETKDVLCILWLSGIQKEDLDANMLRKLQQHNVNIDDIDDIGKLRSRCLNKNYTEYINGTTEINFAKILTTKNQSTTVNDNKANSDQSHTIKMSDLEIAVQHILNRQKFKKMSNESKYDEDREKEPHQEETVLRMVSTENITVIITTTAAPNTEANDDEQEEFENVERNVTIASSKRAIVNPNEMKLLNDLSNDTNLEVDDISRIIADYITRKRKLSANGVNRSLDIRIPNENTLKSVNKVHSKKNDNSTSKKANVKNENDTAVETINLHQKRFSNLNEMKNNPLFIIYNEAHKDRQILYGENKQRRGNYFLKNEYVNNTSEDDDVGIKHGKNAQRDMFREIAYSVKSIVSRYIDVPPSSPTTVTTEVITLSTTKKQNKREMDEMYMYENINKMYQQMQASRAFITQTTEKASTFPRQDQILQGAFEMYKNFGNMYKYFKSMANNKQDGQDGVKIITTAKVPVIQRSARTTIAEQFKNRLHKNSNILMKLTDVYKQLQRLKLNNTTSSTASPSTTVTPQLSTTIKRELQDTSEIFKNLQKLLKLLGKRPDTTTVTTTTETTTTMTTKKIRTKSEETFDILDNLKEIYQKLKIPHESSNLNAEILTTSPNHIEPTEASSVNNNRNDMYTQLTPVRVDFNKHSESVPSPNQIMKPDFARYMDESNSPGNITNFQPFYTYFREGNQQTQMDIPQNIYYNKFTPIQYKSIQNPMPYPIASQPTDSRLIVPRNGPVPFQYQTKLSVNSLSSPNNPLNSPANPPILFYNQPNLPLVNANKMSLISPKNTISSLPSLGNHPMLSLDPTLSENRQVTFNNQISSKTQQISPYDRFYSPKNRQKQPQNMFSSGARVFLADKSPISSYIPQIAPKNSYPQFKNMAANIVQTNFNEVPPLGIRVGEPLKLIHQNLVVHNKNHNNDNANSNRSHRQKYHSTETKELNEFKELTNGHKSKYHKKKDEKYKLKPKVSGKMARFHEILENSEFPTDNKELTPDVDNFDTDPIPSRHQVSMNNIKQYDNFDKSIREMMTTQNKVHLLLDKMLEKDSRERPEVDIM